MKRQRNDSEGMMRVSFLRCSTQVEADAQKRGEQEDDVVGLRAPPMPGPHTRLGRHQRPGQTYDSTAAITKICATVVSLIKKNMRQALCWCLKWSPSGASVITVISATGGCLVVHRVPARAFIPLCVTVYGQA